jgi:ribosome-associated translation inhibitor RaiA
MRVDITGRHVDITPGLRQLIAKSLAKVERVLNPVTGAVVDTESNG